MAGGNGPDTRNRNPARRDARPVQYGPAEYIDPAIHAHVAGEIDDVLERVIKHIDKAIAEQNKEFASGFPGADPAKHRLGHEADDRDRENLRKLKWGLAQSALYGMLAMLALFFFNGGLTTIRLWLK